uniref:Uncharacterized protein n=1 Tax=Arundo donax TaxID=35708 RepID=A0A0A9BIV0_ARUDO
MSLQACSPSACSPSPSGASSHSIPNSGAVGYLADIDGDLDSGG